MSAVTPFILERTAAVAARAAQKQVELLERQNQLLEQLLKSILEQEQRGKTK